jgi:hypothetical protein
MVARSILELQKNNSLSINVELANKYVVNGYSVINDSGYTSDIPGWDNVK